MISSPTQGVFSLDSSSNHQGIGLGENGQVNVLATGEGKGKIQEKKKKSIMQERKWELANFEWTYLLKCHIMNSIF